ncbi:MAG: penicillin-binding protein 2 [Patescibacteria group bacterium]
MRRSAGADPRLRAAAIIVSIVAGLVIFRLSILMIFQHDFYTALAAGSHDVYSQLFPVRGEVFIQGSRAGEEYPLAINRDYFLLYADTRDIDDAAALEVTEKLAEIFSYNEEKKLEIFAKINKRDDPYEPIEQKVDKDVMEKIEELDLPGIYFLRKPYRYYPEGNLAANIIGFVGKTEDGQDIGSYGIEGYWEKELAGSGGFFSGAKSASGFWIPLAGRSFDPATNGADLHLTIDRTIQYYACERLRIGLEEYGASSASLVIMDPATGAIYAMCSLPDFDPNYYNKVSSIEVYNNNTVFVSYEPGSVFKPVVMAGALNENAVAPETIFYDKGFREGLCSKPIKNAAEKVYQDQTMAGVLENSINTGMVFVAEKLGKTKLREYVERFGFGLRTGIELNTEVGGTAESLSINKKEAIDCYAATASFGQGITATPLQLAAAYSAIANGGLLMKPYIVQEVKYDDGRIDRRRPVIVRQVLEKRAASLLSAMLVNVVDRGHAKRAGVPGYFVAAKTGTAQIPGPGGYISETNHTLVGFGPADAPKFVMVVKYEKPRRAYAESTAAPVFGDIAKFILQYYQVPPGR